ncbi:MAG TPA: glycosyltransferase [Chloroflexota bacterium]|jgi:cellulose synthase/poly-beta-1,6-N-acetylglucosamine synthase-like glycosyltransferase
MRVAILIPAHDEAAVIGGSVRCAQAAAPPGTPVFVVADHCTDATATRAREAGGRVYERTADPPGKGPTIRWFLDAAADGLADAEVLVILDADSRPRPGAVARLAAALDAGAGAAQGFVWPVPAGAATAGLLAAYSEWVAQGLDDRLRRRLGWSAPLRGTGMALRLPLLRALAPRLRTRVEDVELTLLLIARGERIAFVPGAVIEDPKPVTAGRAARQRARWLQGQREVWRAYGGLILRLLASGGPGTWWLLGTLLVKPRTGVIAVKLAACGAAAPLVMRPRGRPWLAAALALLAFDVGYYLVGLAVVPAEWRWPVARALVQSPRYVVMWARALALSALARERWLRARE